MEVAMKRSLWVLSSLVLLLTAGFSAPAGSETPKPRAIGRIWRGRTLASKADEYQKYLESNGIPRVRATPGNLGVTVLRRPDGDKTEFLVLSVWESVDAIKKFAGEDYQKAVLLPRDREYLTEVEPNVFHYEVLRDERAK
jgi:heme-degrading monooxygenase HmoA